METFIIIVIVEIAVVFLTGIGCRLSWMRRRQAGWYIALLGAIAVAVLVMFWDNGGLLFDPSQWSANKRSLVSLLTSFVILIVIGIVPALFVVRHYRKRFRDETHVASNDDSRCKR